MSTIIPGFALFLSLTQLCASGTTCSQPIKIYPPALRFNLKPRNFEASLLIHRAISTLLNSRHHPAFSKVSTSLTNPQPIRKRTNMPRQGRSGGGRAPSRPSVAPSRPTPQQTRPATTAAYPPARTNQAAPPAAAPAQQQQGSAGPGLFGQMASTAAYVPPSSNS
jgi:hypothetical protein